MVEREEHHHHHSGGGGVNAVLVLVVVILVVALLWFMGVFGGGEEDADIEADINVEEQSAVPALELQDLALRFPDPVDEGA